MAYLVWSIHISTYSFRWSILYVSDINCRNKILTAKLLRQGYRYHKLRKTFSKFYRRHSGLVEKYNVSLRKLLQQGISEPKVYGELVYRIRKIVGKSDFEEQFRKLINLYKRIGYNPYIMRQTACLVVNPITVDSYVLHFNCTIVRGSWSVCFSCICLFVFYVLVFVIFFFLLVSGVGCGL